jgi:hypothetical protein
MIPAPMLCIEYPTRGLSRQIRRSLTYNIPKSQATKAAELTAREVKSSPSPPSYTMRTKQPRPAAPRFSSCNPHLMPTTPCRQTSRHETEKASWSVLHAELMRHGEHTHHIKAGHARATAELGILHERLEAIEVHREENHSLKRGGASADELRETGVRLEGNVEATCAEREAWCVSPFICLRISGVSLTGGIRARNAVSETPTTTPVSITQSLSALHLEHAHHLEEHGAGHTTLGQHKAELADTQAREVDAHATADALLGLRRTVRRGPSALLPSLSEMSDS